MSWTYRFLVQPKRIQISAIRSRGQICTPRSHAYFKIKPTSFKFQKQPQNQGLGKEVRSCINTNCCVAKVPTSQVWLTAHYHFIFYMAFSTSDFHIPKDKVTKSESFFVYYMEPQHFAKFLFTTSRFLLFLIKPSGTGSYNLSPQFDAISKC